MQRGIVEDEARRVVLEQRRGSELRPELLLLIRAEQLVVAVDRDDILVAGEQPRAVGHALERLVLAQRPVVGKGIGVKIRRQRLQVEAGGDLARTQPQSTTLNSTLRSSASFASSLPMPIKFSCEPTPIALVRVFSAAASASRRCLTYCARCSEMRSLTGSEPL